MDEFPYWPVSPPNDTGLWLHNRGHKMGAVLTGMEIHAIHQWSRDNDWFFQYFSVLATTEVLTEQVGVLGYWLYKSQEELIKWSTGSRAARTAYDRTNRTLDPILLTFRKSNTQRERDRRRLREYDAPYRPYVELSFDYRYTFYCVLCYYC